MLLNKRTQTRWGLAMQVCCQTCPSLDLLKPCRWTTLGSARHFRQRWTMLSRHRSSLMGFSMTSFSCMLGCGCVVRLLAWARIGGVACTCYCDSKQDWPLTWHWPLTSTWVLRERRRVSIELIEQSFMRWIDGWWDEEITATCNDREEWTRSQGSSLTLLERNTCRGSNRPNQTLQAPEQFLPGKLKWNPATARTNLNI